MIKALIIVAMGVFTLGQAPQGVITSTDLDAPDVSAAERGAPAAQPQAKPKAQPAQTKPMPKAEPAPVAAPKTQSEEPKPAPRQPDPKPAAKNTDNGRIRDNGDKAVAAFWIIMPER